MNLLSWVESLVKVLFDKVMFPNWEKIQNWFIKSPTLVAALSIIPIFGVLISYGVVLDQGKFLLLLFLDILMFLALPLYPFYKLFIAFDAWVLTNRRKAGKEISNMEWFWN